MEDDDKYARQSRFSEWLEGSWTGQKILNATLLLRRLWHLHLDRYRLWDETYYRVRTWLVVIAVCLVIGEGVKLGHRRYLRREEFRAQVDANNFLARGDFRNANLSANRALMFNANNLPACRVMAALAEEANSPTVLDWLGRIAQNQPTLANKINLAMAGLRFQGPPFAFTAGLLNSLPPSATNYPGYQEAAAKLAMGLHRYAEAEAHYAMAGRLAPTNFYYTVSEALLQLLSTNQSKQLAGQETLLKFRTNASFGVFALRGLVANRVESNDLATAEIYSRELVAMPQANRADHLQYLGLMHQLHSPEFPALLRSVEQEAMKSELAISQVSDWMRANGLVEENLEWMMTLPNSMLDRPQVQINRARGYLQNTNWQRLREVASTGDWGDLEYLRFALVSHASAKLGSAEMADSNWQAAMKEASSHLANMEHLLNLAESWDLKHEREQLLLWMVRDFPSEQWVQRLVQIYVGNGNTLGLHQLYGVLEEYYPTNTICQNDLAATEMLLKINLNEAFELSASAYSKSPTNGMVASTYAYSLHMQDRDLQGLDALKNLPPATLEQPNVALYYGILLASAGRHEEARTWLNLAQTKGTLLPEERTLLATAWAEIGGPPPN